MQRQGKLNALLSNNELEEVVKLNQECLHFMALVTEKLDLSPRSYHRVLKVARAISDLANIQTMELRHIKEAISYRAYERLINTLTRV